MLCASQILPETRLSGFSAFSHLVDFIGGVRRANMPQVALLHGYFDESGKWADKDTISFCGWISEANRWELFAKEWSGLLDELGLPCLHTSDFVHPGRRAENGWSFRQEDIEPTLLRFCAIVKEYAITGCGIGVDTKHFRTMKQSFRAKIKNPHFVAFKILMNSVLGEVKSVQWMFPVHDWRCGIICDQDPGTSEHCLRHFNRLRQFDPVARKLLNGICFADATGAIPLQAADLLAYVLRTEIERRRTKDYASPSVLFRDLSFKRDVAFPGPIPILRSFFMDAQFLDELAEGKHDQLLESLGIEI